MHDFFFLNFKANLKDFPLWIEVGQIINNPSIFLLVEVGKKNKPKKKTVSPREAPCSTVQPKHNLICTLSAQVIVSQQCFVFMPCLLGRGVFPPPATCCGCQSHPFVGLWDDWLTSEEKETKLSFSHFKGNKMYMCQAGDQFLWFQRKQLNTFSALRFAC